MTFFLRILAAEFAVTIAAVGLLWLSWWASVRAGSPKTGASGRRSSGGGWVE